MKVILCITLIISVNSCSKLRWVSKPKSKTQDERHYDKFMTAYLEDLKDSPSPKVPKQRKKSTKKQTKK